MNMGQDAKKKRHRFYQIYSVFFGIISFMMIALFVLSGVSLVWSKDGLAQHYPTLVYCHRFLSALVKNIFQGRFVFPMVDYSLGEGMDILTTLNYYGFGDPLLLLSLLCPMRYLEILYAVLILIRLYLSGLFFSWFCFLQKKKEIYVLAGALTYVFCGFALYASIRHPFFINGMIYLPLYLIAADAIQKKKKYFLLSLVVCLSLFSNFYFAYMNTVLLGICVLVFLLTEKEKSYRDRIKCVIHMALAYLSGVAMAMVIILPVSMAYLQCSRGGDGGYVDSMLAYPRSFYRYFIKSYVSARYTAGEWTNLNFCVLCIFCVICLFIHRAVSQQDRRNTKILRILYLVLTFFMLIPFGGKIMNGFGYVSNRWNFGYAMLNAYLLVYFLPFLGSDYYRFFYKLTNFFSKRKNFLQQKLKKIRERLKGQQQKWSLFICLFVLVNLLANIIISYSGNRYHYLAEFSKMGKVNAESGDTSIRAISGIHTSESKLFYRVEQPWTIGNQSLSSGYYGHNWYFSIAPKNYFEYYNGFQLNSMERTYSLRGLDGRAALNALTSTRYYTTSRKEDGLIPYGYHLIKTINKGKKTKYLYQNAFYLPLGYTTAAWTKSSEYNRLSPIEKQEALMESVVIQDHDASQLSVQEKSASKLNMDVKEEVCNVVSMSGITWQNGRLKTYQKNASVELSFQGMPHAETYLWLYQFQVIKSSRYQTATVESDHTLNHFVLIDPDKSAWYDNPQQTINLGYSVKARKHCVITIPEKGIYSLKHFMVVYQPMDNYEAQIKALGTDHLKNLKIGTNRISGNIMLSKMKFLQMSIPYSKGWHAKVNGKPARIFRSNMMYMALQLPAGKSNIVFSYRTPYLATGMCISILMLFSWFLFDIWKRHKR